MIRVAVLGAAGKMGAEVCRAVSAAGDLALVAAVDPAFDTGAPAFEDAKVSPSIDVLVEAGADVAVDFTHPASVDSNIAWCVAHGVHVVVGTTGLQAEQLAARGQEAAEAGVGLFVAPNFAIGAVLMMRFASEAAKHLPIVEIVELHHDQKADAPSGTALATADAIRAARAGIDVPGRRVESAESHPGARGADLGDGVRIHSVRMPGLVAHQEVLLGGPGEQLTIRHDSLDRAGFMPGVLLAVRSVASRPGLTIGLDNLL